MWLLFLFVYFLKINVQDTWANTCHAMHMYPITSNNSNNPSTDRSTLERVEGYIPVYLDGDVL